MGNTFRTGKLMNGLYVDDSGNVGIGTTAPFSGIAYAQGLQVKSASNNAFVRVNSGSYTGIDLLQQTDGNAALWNRDNAYLAFGTNNTERMRITSAGNVGIGTTSPIELLEVFGKGRFSIYGTAGINETLKLVSNANYNAGRGVKMGFYVPAGTNSEQLGAEIGAVTTASTSSDLFFNTTNAGVSTEAMRLTSDNHLKLTSTTAGGTNLDMYLLENDGLYINSNEGATPRGTYFQAGGVETMRIGSNGNVEIGTSGIGYKLAVYTTGANANLARFRTIDSSNNPYLDIRTSGTAVILDANGSASGTMIFQTGGGERGRFTSNGELLLHSTSFNSTLVGQLFGTGGDTYFTTNGQTTMYLNRLTNNGTMLIFQYNSSTVGTISTNANSLPSDRNFKKDITDISIGLDLVTKLRPVHYRHNFDDADEALSNGIIAQELEEALLECGIEKNSLLMLQHKPNEKEGESQYWVDYTKMIPVLIKSIQEQQEIINNLSAKVTALENK